MPRNSVAQLARTTRLPQASRASIPSIVEKPPLSAPAKIGRYRLITELGSGGMGEVFLAMSDGPEGFRKLVVVKRLRPALASDPLSRQMFIREACLAARLQHPNIVQTYEVGASEGSYFLSMEYLEGRTLRELLTVSIACGIRPDPPLWVHLVSEILAGLHHAHELADFDGTPLGVVHRDVSPHNIVITYDGQVRLIDFGVAKLTARPNAVQTGIIAGKRGYMAPEIRDGQSADRRADVFAMGIVLWEALAQARLPAPRRLTKTGGDVYPRVSSVVRRIDPKLDAIVAKALHVSPDKRFPTALAMRDALDTYLERAGVVRRRDVSELMNAYFAEDRAGVADTVRARAGRAPTLSLVPDTLSPESGSPSSGWGPLAAAQFRREAPTVPPPGAARRELARRELAGGEFAPVLAHATRLSRIAVILMAFAVLLSIASILALLSR